MATIPSHTVVILPDPLLVSHTCHTLPYDTIRQTIRPRVLALLCEDALVLSLFVFVVSSDLFPPSGHSCRNGRKCVHWSNVP